MKTTLYYVKTNGYDMVVAQDADGYIRYLVENDYFPRIKSSFDSDEEEIATGFLNSIEDLTSYGWDDDIQDIDELINTTRDADRDEILATIEKDL